jgi:hypothetical protein
MRLVQQGVIVRLQGEKQYADRGSARRQTRYILQKCQLPQQSAETQYQEWFG